MTLLSITILHELTNEKQESYEWLLRCYLEACEIPLLTFVTDTDPAIIAAISTVFSETHHMQCLYHLYQNLLKNLRSCLGSPLYQEFLKDFRAIQRSYCESVFEHRSAASDDDSFEPFFDKEVDDSIKTPIEADEDWELDLKSLISMVNSGDILEIWKVPVFVNTSKAYFHLILIPKQFTQKYTVNDLSESYFRQISQKQLKFGILMGEAKKAIQFAIQDDDEN
ncbi:hypothetical protein RhiirA4_457253 [Rhizophagus irregularis]|uniref:MULE transposase domain-containing protein n=1 Tax=Rhizophagus irregularis TaxID=588596 RepID=A0A2I1G9N9_9GLOM|nr:hypothetical protein RhiirA4_457253 [Rhizophagus irregularis]